MTVHAAESRNPTEPFGVRVPRVKLRILEAIGSHRGHTTRNDAVNEAIDEYIERHMPEIQGGKAVA